MMTHGLRSTYTKGGCRCEKCTAANTAFSRARRRRKNPPVHGTRSGYFNHGCRCDPCKAAGSIANAANARKHPRYKQAP